MKLGPRRREAAGGMTAMQESSLKATVRGRYACVASGAACVVRVIPHDHCRLRRNQFLACFDPILGEQLFSVIL